MTEAMNRQRTDGPRRTGALGPSSTFHRSDRREDRRALVPLILIVSIVAVLAPIAALDSRKPERAVVHVHISGSAFDPNPVTVTEGDDVVWHNHDGVSHTSRSDLPGWDTGTILPGGTSAAVTFSTVGSFPYHCGIHLSMTSSVEVLAPGAEFPAATVLPAFAMLLILALFLLRQRVPRSPDPL